MKILPTVEIPPKVIKTAPKPKKNIVKQVTREKVINLNPKKDKVDIDKLARAVAMAETGGGKK